MGGVAAPEKGGSKGTNNAAFSAIAGAVSGCVARFVVGPLDVLKIRFQVQVEPVSRRAASRAGAAVPKYTGIGQALVTIAREEGVLALWRGTIPGQLLTIPYCSVQFVTNNQAKAWARKKGLLDTPFAPVVSFASGAVAGVSATIASYPFDLLRTQLAAQGEPKVYNNMIDAARGIVEKRGIQGLYVGLKPTIIEIIPYAALQFGLYDSLNAGMTEMRFRALNAMPWHRKVEKKDMPPSAPQQFLCGLFAGILAKLGTHPMDVAKKRFQVAGLARSTAYGARVDSAVTNSLWGCLRTMYLNEGLRGLYKGVGPSILKAAVTFAVYEHVLRELKWQQEKKQREEEKNERAKQ